MRTLQSTLAVASIALAVMASGAPPIARADAAQDQQFLEIVRSNGIGGQDQTLLAYAQQVCTTPPGDWNFSLVPELLNQIGWFNTGGIYVIQTAASRVYCPNKIIQPPAVYQPPVIINTG